MSTTEPSLHLTGKLRQKDIRRLTNVMRGATVGPTTLYYAGVTAPVIGAGMALLSSAAFELTSMNAYWRTMSSAMIAAMAGIVWYLIFMRWAYRHRQSRGGETEQATELTVSDAGLSIRRDAVETRIGWSALIEVKLGRGYTLLKFKGADPLIVPDSWFGKDKAAQNEFRSRLQKGMS